MKQNAITVIVPIKKGQDSRLEKILTQIGKDVMGSKDNQSVVFSKSPSTHFARWAILRNNELTEDQTIDPRLFFSSNFDGDLNDYLKELVQVMGPGMDPIWSKCVGYPPKASKNAAKFTRFIEDHAVKNQAFFNGFPGVTVKDILSSIRVREVVNRILDNSGARQYLSLMLELLFAMQQRKAPSSPMRVQRPNIAELHGQPPLAWFPKFMEGLVGLSHGQSNPNSQVRAATNVTSIEDKAGVVQNQMTAITPIKPRMWPRLALRIWLVGVINWFRRFLMLLDRPGLLWWVLKHVLFFLPEAGPRGQLNGITTIHFARWAIIDKGKNLLFESNYDGSWEKYIDDFVDLSAFGMNMIWANCVGYPTGGCRDIESFKAYIRKSQLPTQVFYSAYPQETVNNIINDLVCSNAVEKFVDLNDYSKSVTELLQQKEIKQFLSGRYSFP